MDRCHQPTHSNLDDNNPPSVISDSVVCDWCGHCIVSKSSEDTVYASDHIADLKAQLLAKDERIAALHEHIKLLEIYTR